MATTITQVEELALLDGTAISVRPLRISLLREFMKKFEGISKVAEDNEKSMDILMECVQIAMRQYKPDLAADAKALEDNLDLPTVYKIVEAASGIQLSDSGIIG